MGDKTLAERAEALGIKFVGVKTKKLIKAVEEAEAKLQNDSPEAPELAPESEKDANTAIVYEKKFEKRRFTKEIHGKGFAKLAKQFASDRENYRVELVRTKPSVKCPSCGYVLNK